MSFDYTSWQRLHRPRPFRLSHKSGWLAFCDSGPRAPLPVLSTDQVNRLSEDELFDYNRARGVWTSNLPIVRTHQVAHAFAVLDQVIASTNRDGDRIRATGVLDGPSGLGKTTVASTYCRQFHRSAVRTLGPVTDNGHQRLPVATIRLSARTTPKMLLTKLATFYAEKVASSVNSDRLAEVVVDMVISCETDLIAIDELHWIEPRSKDGQGLSNQLKWLANELPCAFILAGVGLAEKRFYTEGSLGDLAGSTAQTSRRSTRIPITPFTMSTDAGARAWTELLGHLEPQLKLAEAKPGVLTQHAQLIFDRTQGYIGSLAQLVERACRISYHSGTETITEQMLRDVVLDNGAERSRAADSAPGLPPVRLTGAGGTDPDRWPMQVPRRPGESLHGWLWRLAYRYGLNPRATLRLLGCAVPPQRAVDIDRLLEHADRDQIAAQLAVPAAQIHPDPIYVALEQARADYLSRFHGLSPVSTSPDPGTAPVAWLRTAPGKPPGPAPCTPSASPTTCCWPTPAPTA